MENYFYLCSENPGDYIINNTYIYNTKNHQDYITIKTDEPSFVVDYYPTSQFPKLNVHTTILCTNTVTSSSANCNVIKYTPHHYKIIFNNITLITQKPTKVIKQKVLDNVTLLLIDGTMQSVLIHKDAKNNSITLNYHIKDADFIKINMYYALIGKMENKDYLLVFDTLGKIYLEETNDIIEITGNSIQSLQKMYDIAQHGYVTSYTLNSEQISIKEKYSVYLEDTPKTPHNVHSISMAFLEAVNIENFKLARTYLDSNLSSTLDDQQIIKYFGEYESFEPNFLVDVENSIFFVYPSNIVKLFRFKIENEKIVDIQTD